MRTQQSYHDEMVQEMVCEFERRRMHVDACLEGRRGGPPDPVDGRVPDLVATSAFKRIILEVETPETLSDEKTRDQMKAFSGIDGVEFHVAVPSGCVKAMKDKAKEWGIQIDEIWSMGI